MDGERVNVTCEFCRKQLINHPVPFQPGLSLECFRYDINTVMSLPARPVPGMAFVLVRFIHHVKALRRESLGQLLCDEIDGPHAARLREGCRSVNGRNYGTSRLSLEGVNGKSA